MGNNFLKTIKPFIAKYEPELLMSTGISGMIFSTIWGIKTTVTAAKIIKKEQEKINDIANANNEPAHILQTNEKIKLVWKLYLPVVLSMAISIPCIVLGNRVSNNRSMALAAAYTISETALQEYQDKTREISGDKLNEKIQSGISNDRVKKSYDGNMPNVTLIGDGESLFFEPLSARYFKTTWNRISKAANELNSLALGNVTGVIMLGDWYDILGLASTGLDDVLGWSIIDGKQGIIDITIDSVLTPDDQPCGAIRYNSMPKKV